MKILKVIAIALLFTATACAQKTETTTTTKKLDYSLIDYSKRSNIIKHPENLTGDEKAIFQHKFFQKLNSKETENLAPQIVKIEFAKLGITTEEKRQFQNAYSFFMSKYTSHKKSCENWYFHFKDLAPDSQN